MALLKFTAKEIIRWAWERGIPDVPYEKSRDITGYLYDALKERGIYPDRGIFTVSEEELFEIVTAHKHKIFHLLPGGMSREMNEQIAADYWKSVEAEELALDAKFQEDELADILDGEPLGDY